MQPTHFKTHYSLQNIKTIAPWNCHCLGSWDTGPEMQVSIHNIYLEVFLESAGGAEEEVGL